MSVVSSLIAGRPADDAPGGTIAVRNPSRLEDVLAEAALGDASTLVEACHSAREAQAEWSRVPGPVRGRAIQQIGRLVEDNKDALAAHRDRKSTRLNSSHVSISYAVFCLKKKKHNST